MECIVYEPISAIFDKALDARPEIETLLKNDRVKLIRDINALSDFVQRQKITDIDFTFNRSYNELFKEEFSAVHECITANIRKKEIGDSTLKRFGKIWTKNILRNMHRFFEGKKLIPYINWDKPSIVVGAGPSLIDALPYIKRHKHCAVIIACDTALPILQNHDINPDFTVTVDLTN